MNTISQKIILLIDRDLQASKKIAKTLALDNLVPIVAKDSKTGLQLAKERNIDLILCDHTIAKQKDYVVLTKFKQDGDTQNIPLIVLDREIDIAVWRKVMSLGADDYLSKERIQDLKGAIAAQFKKQAAQQQSLQEELENLQAYINNTLPHELRAPLTSIIASSDFLIAEEIESIDREIIHEMLDFISLSAKRLNKSIEKFLLHSQLQQTSNDPQKIQNLRNSQTISIADIIEKKAKKQTEKAQRQADLQLKIEDASVGINTNNLGKILEELIENACKFSQPGTPICVKTSLERDLLVISVSDRGRGMTAKQINSIGPYIQFERQIHEQQGVGLGLAIAKSLTELHQGQLSIESIPNRATTVSISLPKANQSPSKLIFLREQHNGIKRN